MGGCKFSSPKSATSPSCKPLSSTIPNVVDDKITDRLRTHWDKGEIVGIIGVVALFGLLNRWNDSIGTEIEKGAIESREKFFKGRG